MRLEVRPDDASVYVDDQFRGTAREARIMNLPPGRHMIELVRPGFGIKHGVHSESHAPRLTSFHAFLARS